MFMYATPLTLYLRMYMSNGSPFSIFVYMSNGSPFSIFVISLFFFSFFSTKTCSCSARLVSVELVVCSQ